MAGGQQINSGQGTLIGVGGDNNYAVTGSASTSAAGSVGRTALVPLRSRKSGTGTAARLLTGSESAVSPGTIGFSRGPALTESALTGQQGTLTYGGLATLSLNANTESDLAGYRVYHGTVSSVYTENVSLGLVTTYQWGGLTGGQTHYFAVTAFDTSNNESALSVQVSKAY